jgi:hypothetical protein
MAKEQVEEKQEPQKSKLISSGMKLPVIIGIVAGVLIINTVIIIFVFKLFVAPSFTPHSEDAVKGKTELENKEKAKHNGLKIGEEGEYLQGEENLHFTESGRITTNPKNSENFIVLNLGLEYRFKTLESKPKEGEGLSPKMLAQVKGAVNRIIGGLSIDELHAKRDSLTIIFIKEMKPTFKANQMFLKNVILQEFIIQ